MIIFRYFLWAFLFTILGLGTCAWLGFAITGTIAGAISIFFICLVLSVLEISLSFDNAIINARILRDMTPIWQKRFLTWGILIAVFGVRIVFPLAVVAIAAWMNPISVVRIAIWNPDEYAHLISEANIGILAYGGTFLLMVGMKYFFDIEKNVHWFEGVERYLSKFASLQGIEIAIALIMILFFAYQVPDVKTTLFMTAALYGLLTFIAMESLSKILDATQEQMSAIHRNGLAAFIYLEILDTSFSFDGVVSAFALSSNLFVIAIGLGIGALYVRSLTILLVDKETLSKYRYLEHGAFYAILVLAVIMYLQTFIHIPEVITGLIGAGLILASFLSSIHYNHVHLRSIVHE